MGGCDVADLRRSSLTRWWGKPGSQPKDTELQKGTGSGATCISAGHSEGEAESKGWDKYYYDSWTSGPYHICTGETLLPCHSGKRQGFNL